MCQDLSEERSRPQAHGDQVLAIQSQIFLRERGSLSELPTDSPPRQRHLRSPIDRRPPVGSNRCDPETVEGGETAPPDPACQPSQLGWRRIGARWLDPDTHESHHLPSIGVGEAKPNHERGGATLGEGGHVLGLGTGALRPPHNVQQSGQAKNGPMGRDTIAATDRVGPEIILGAVGAGHAHQSVQLRVQLREDSSLSVQLQRNGGSTRCRQDLHELLPDPFRGETLE